MSFNFLNSAGQTMTPNAVTFDASAKFHAYFFPASSVGGAFTVQASFPVTGDVTTVSTVAVTMSNSAVSNHSVQNVPVAGVAHATLGACRHP